jgi:hypothetical protein
VLHAYRDDGPMSVKTRWRPRRVFCTLASDHGDQPGQLFVVKFQQGQSGAAALVSEIVCTTLLSRAGFQTLDWRLVQASSGFANSCNVTSNFPYPIREGVHFGTLLRDDVEAGPPLSYDDLAKPRDIIDLWVMDTWLGNIDRDVDGNTLLKVTASGKFQVIASDQSDCFCGASTFSSSDFERIYAGSGTARSVAFLANVIFQSGGSGAITEGIRRARGCVPQVGEVFELVPNELWVNSGLNHRTIQRAMQARAERLEQILRPDQWEVPYGGALIINI